MEDTYRSLYLFFTGHGLWAAIMISLGGIFYNGYFFMKSSKKRHLQGVRPLADRDNSPFKRAAPFSDRFLLVITTVFHVMLFAIPISVGAHGVLLHINTGILPPSASKILIRLFYVLFFTSAVMLLIRRIAVPAVRIMTRLSDVIFWIFTLVPFVSGIMAVQQAGPYGAVMTVHLLSSILFIALAGWWKPGHMVMLLFSKIYIANEFHAKKRNRKWS